MEKNLFCEKDALKSESEVEQFFIIRLLGALGYEDNNIRINNSLANIDIPKGSIKEAYRPDYVCFYGDKPLIVIEAKNPLTNIDNYTYQVAGYAHVLNCGFKGENPIRFTILTNGHLFNIYNWDENEPILTLEFNDFHENNKKYVKLKELISYNNIKELCGIDSITTSSNNNNINGISKNEKFIFQSPDCATSHNLDDIYPEFPIKGLILPKGWDFSDKGVFTIKGNPNSSKRFESEIACSVPIGIKARYRDIHTHEEKVGITWHADDAWRSLKARRSIIFNKQKIINLADNGLPVTSERSKALVNYLSGFEDANKHIFRPVRSTTRYGWCSKTEFIPYGAPAIELDMFNHLDGCRVQGSLAEWMQAIAPLYQTFPTRAMMASSFAVPLLRIINGKSMAVHLGGSSGRGKTATLKGALSVWGDPDQMMINFNATRVGIERSVAMHNDLPLGIDEKQAGSTKNKFIEMIVYVASGGISKAKGTNDGTTSLAPMSYWRTIALTIGKHTLTDDDKLGGVKTRIVELVMPFMTDEDAHAVHKDSTRFFGIAGYDYIQKLISADRDEIIAIYNDIIGYLLPFAQNKSRSHVDLLACMATGDVLSRRWLWGYKNDLTLNEAKVMAKYLLQELEDNDKRDDTKRAIDMFASWVWGNENRFIGTTSGSIEQFGEFVSESSVRILPNQFKKLMIEWGFSPRRTLNGLKERGLLVMGESKHNTIKSSTFSHGRRVRMYEIKLSQDY